MKLSCLGCSRRDVLKGIGVAAAATLVPGCTQSGSSLPTATTTSCGAGMLCIALGDVANKDLTMPGGAMLIDSASDTIMVIRMSQTDVVAVSAICTHAGCSMDFDAAGQRITCPCHGSVFGEDGHVINGPANRALKVYSATLTADQITVTS